MIKDTHIVGTETDMEADSGVGYRITPEVWTVRSCSRDLCECVHESGKVTSGKLKWTVEEIEETENGIL